jgi:hypothetical protein
MTLSKRCVADAPRRLLAPQLRGLRQRQQLATPACGVLSVCAAKVPAEAAPVRPAAQADARKMRRSRAHAPAAWRPRAAVTRRAGSRCSARAPAGGSPSRRALQPGSTRTPPPRHERGTSAAAAARARTPRRAHARAVRARRRQLHVRPPPRGSCARRAPQEKIAGTALNSGGASSSSRNESALCERALCSSVLRCRLGWAQRGHEHCGGAAASMRSCISRLAGAAAS